VFGALNPLDFLRPFDFLWAFDFLRPLDFFGAFDFLNPFDLFRPFDGLDPLDLLRSLRFFGMPDSFCVAGAFGGFLGPDGFGFFRLFRTLFRVIQECINNALKHARASHIDVAVNLEKNGISVTVEDDGVGFSLSETAASGIGMENIRRRTHYLNGTVEWDSSPGNGTLVAISIPLK